MKWNIFFIVLLLATGCFGGGTLQWGTLTVTVEPGEFTAASSYQMLLVIEAQNDSWARAEEVSALPAAVAIERLPSGDYYVWVELHIDHDIRRSHRFSVAMTRSDERLAIDLADHLPAATEPAALAITVTLGSGPETQQFAPSTMADALAAPWGNEEDAMDDASTVVSIKLAPGADPDTLSAQGWEIVRSLPSIQRVFARPPAAGIQLQGLEDTIIAVDPLVHYEAQGTVIPDDPRFGDQESYLKAMQLPEAWAVTTGSHQIRVAVLDVRVDHTHPDLQGRLDLADTRSFVGTASSGTSDMANHGTHVAGIIGAATNNSQGIAGVDWHVTMVSLAVLSEEGSGSTANVAAAVLYAAGLEPDADGHYISEPVHIINLSLGTTSSEDETMREAVEQAAASGILLVAAAGNDGDDILRYPAGFADVIAVGSVGLKNGKWETLSEFSNFGAGLDILAPGEHILSTIDGGAYGDKSGTSMATPHVTGVLSLLLAAGLEPWAAWQHLQEAAGASLVSTRNGNVGLLKAADALALVDWTQVQPLLPPLAHIHLERLVQPDDVLQEVYAATLELPWNDGTHLWPNLPPGTYKLTGWLDVTESGSPTTGDYWFEQELQLWPGWHQQEAMVLQPLSE